MDQQIRELLAQRRQLTLLARNPDWILAPGEMTQEQLRAASGAFFDADGAVHQTIETERERDFWLDVLPNPWKRAVDLEVAKESELPKEEK